MAGLPRRDIYMGIPAVRGEKEESYEEIRVKDYLKAYTSTGRPPVPCPPGPTGAAERAALGLPPLFEPYSEVVPYEAGRSISGTVMVGNATGTLPSIPDVHVFRPTPVPGEAQGGFFQTVNGQPEFSAWSFEELRLSAYRKGRKFIAVPPPPQAPPQALAAPVQVNGGNFSDRILSITCAQPFEKHSFEELRLAFVRAGRQLNSAEIIQQNATLKLS